MRTFMNRLKSRKLWITIGAVAGCVLTALCGEPSNAEQITALVGAVVSAVTYVISEAAIDKAAIPLKGEENNGTD